jgi:putative acetyltransferase
VNAVQQVRQWSRQMVRELGFMQPHVAGEATHSQCHTLIELSRQGPRSVTQLAAALRLDKSSASRLVAELARRGWIKVTTDPRDARGRIATPVPAGRRALEGIDTDADRRVGEALGTLSDEQRDTVVRGLSLYAAALERARTASEMEVREITAHDDAAVARIIRTVMPEFGCEGPGFAINDPEVGCMSETYGTPKSRYFVIEHHGEVVGGGGFGPLAGGTANTCELRKMYFLRHVRGLGMGRRLLAHCLEAAHKLGYSRMYLETLKSMTAANKLYRQFGFQPCTKPMGDTGHFSCDAWYIKILTEKKVRKAAR